MEASFHIKEQTSQFRNWFVCSDNSTTFRGTSRLSGVPFLVREPLSLSFSLVFSLFRSLYRFPVSKDVYVCAERGAAGGDEFPKRQIRRDG